MLKMYPQRRGRALSNGLVFWNKCVEYTGQQVIPQLVLVHNRFQRGIRMNSRWISGLRVRLKVKSRAWCIFSDRQQAPSVEGVSGTHQAHLLPGLPPTNPHWHDPTTPHPLLHRLCCQPFPCPMSKPSPQSLTASRRAVHCAQDDPAHLSRH
jgi:hypothetical protein